MESKGNSRVRKGYSYLIKYAALLRAEGLPVFDLTNIFKGEKKTVYRDICCHMNDLGHKYMEDKILEYVVAEIIKREMDE